MARYVLFDVGGTNIKVDVYEAQVGFSAARPTVYPARSQETRAVILDNFAQLLKGTLAREVPDPGELTGVGFAFPGPFDYPKGISLIHGLNKYEEIYGFNLKTYITQCLADQGYGNVPLLFMNDAQAFGLGEAHRHRPNKGLYITLGTGCGSCFIVSGKIVKPDIPGVNAEAMIYDAPFDGSIIDDHLSARGLQMLIVRSGVDATSGLALFEQADRGHPEAEAVFHEFGRVIELALKPFVIAFQPDELVFGGEISRSLMYIAPGFEQLPQLTHIDATQNTSLSTMLGLVAELGGV